MRNFFEMRNIAWACIVAVAGTFSGQLEAQAVGTIVGTISDSTGAVIPQAKVTATRAETNVAQTTLSGNAGNFALPNLAVGTYTITAESPGFAPSRIEGVTLDVSQQRNIDFKLTPAGARQTAIVTAEAPTINTADGSLAGLVTEEQVQDLPLNGRSIQNLVMLQPGMAQDSGAMGWLAPQWISDGNRGETEVATLDGADATDSEMGTVQFWNFNLDAIAEFKVQQANYSAQFGQGGGTITQIVTKSGTNQFHGSAFEFIRNSAFDARNYFSTSVPPFQRNEFGATLGGPIFRNKTFFFGEYAGFRQRLGEPTVIPVPTSAERSGVVTILDPSQNPYQYQAPLNPAASTILGKYPLPNQPGGIYGANTYNFLFKQPLDVDQYSIRIDHHLSDKDSFFGRASHINNTSQETDPVAAIENPSYSSSLINEPRNYALSETHIFSPKLINVALFSVNRQIEGVQVPLQNITLTTFSDSSLANYGPDGFITHYAETYYNPSDNVTWTKGKNLLNIGLQYRYGQDNGGGVTGPGPNGTYVFSPGTALAEGITSTDGGPAIPANSPSPNGLVSMMTGSPASYSRSSAIPGFGPTGGGVALWGMRLWHLSSYIQDDMKLTPHLTLNLGIRWEFTSVPYEIENRFGGVADSGPLYGNFVVNPEPIYPSQHGLFSPRIGAAYEFNGKTVFRGGFAALTNLIPTVYPDEAGVDFPIASLSTITNPGYSLSPLSVVLPSLTSTNGAVMPPGGDPKKIPANTPVNLAPIAALLGPVEGYWASNRLKNGSTLAGNFTIERQLPVDMALQATYVTTHALDLYSPNYSNGYTGAESTYTPFTNVSPGLGEFQLQGNSSISHYNALQLQLRKNSPLHGLQYQASYTWSKLLTNADDLFSASGQSGGQSQNNPFCIPCEYAPASYSVKQRLVANFSYAIPNRWGAVPKRISNGWTVLGIYNEQSGFPFNITGPFGTQQFGFDTLNFLGARPFFVQKAPRNKSGVPQFFASSVVAQNGLNGTYFNVPTVPNATLGTVQTAPGDLGRNTYTGPGWWNYDMSVSKDTHIAERIKFQFRAEFFNILNHATFATPTSNLGNTSFGYSLSTASPERQIQFGGRFEF